MIASFLDSKGLRRDELSVHHGNREVLLTVAQITSVYYPRGRTLVPHKRPFAGANPRD
jgi:hypothetical protein